MHRICVHSYVVREQCQQVNVSGGGSRMFVASSVHGVVMRA